MSGEKQGIAARLLAPVAEVRRGEAGSVLLMALVTLFFISNRVLYREREQPVKAVAA